MMSAIDGLIDDAESTAHGTDMDKESLVARVKAYQRNGTEQRDQWYSYCRKRGTSSFDPSRHDAPFLAGFVKALDRGDIGEGAGTSSGSSGPTEKIFVGGLPKDCTE